MDDVPIAEDSSDPTPAPRQPATVSTSSLYSIPTTHQPDLQCYISHTAFVADSLATANRSTRLTDQQLPWIDLIEGDATEAGRVDNLR